MSNEFAQFPSVKTN